MRHLTVLAAALCLCVLHVAAALAEEPLRGDFPPRANDEANAPGGDLDAAAAEDLARRVHALLLERLGPDVVTDAELWMGAVQGMLDVANRAHADGVSRTQAALPPANMLMNADDASRLGDALRGNLSGVGIEFKLYSRPGVLVVSRVLPGSPAEAAGMLAGDRIVALDGRGLAGLDLQGVLGLLQGDEGSQIAVQFQRGDGLAVGAFAVGVQRAAFQVRSTVDELRHGGVGYIRVFGFHRGTPVEVKEAVERLEKLGADRYVLDLRNNHGGDLVGAFGVADLFLKRGTVLGRIVEPGVGEQDVAAEAKPVTDANLVVLVNAWTHGAAEAVAAALQEHDRAYVIGEPTMGSARTETLVQVGDSLVLRIASVRLLTPTGRSWQSRGVLPDQPFWGPGDEDEGSANDQAFDMAVHYLETEGG